MKKFLKIGALLASVSLLSGCIGEKVEIPPASVGMILGPNGYQGDIIPPSRFRLDPCFLNCDRLVTIVAGDIGLSENMEVLMPKDNLILGVGVQFTLALSEDRNRLLAVFDRVVPQQLESGHYGTTLEQIYATYGRAIVLNVVRATLSKYTIQEIAANQGAVSEQLRRDVAVAFERTPLEVKQFGLADLDYPSTIKESMEATTRRKIDIERAEADAQVKIREAQAQLEVTRAQREADLLAAQTIAESNRLLAEGVSQELLRYMEIEAMKIMAENPNTVFFPVQMMDNIGLQNRVFETKPTE